MFSQPNFPYIDSKQLRAQEEICQKVKQKHIGLTKIRGFLEQSAWIEDPSEFYSILLAIEKCLNSTDIRNVERLSKLPSTLEDVYVCLSILCEQQEIVQNEEELKKIKMELGVEHSIVNFPWTNTLQPELSRFDEAKRLSAEDKLHNMGKPFDCKSADEIIIKKIDEATTHQLPLELVTKIVDYDNPYRHRLFGIKNTLQQATFKACEIDERLIKQLSGR